MVIKLKEERNKMYIFIDESMNFAVRGISLSVNKNII